MSDLGRALLRALPTRPDSDAGILLAVADYLTTIDKIIIEKLVPLVDQDERSHVLDSFDGSEMQDDLRRIAEDIE